MKTTRSKLCGAVLILLFLNTSVFAATRTVKQSGGYTYTTIAAAYSAAVAGDTIEIMDSATYYEYLTIAKANLTIKGTVGERPLIQAVNSGAWGAGFTVTATNVIFQNLTIYTGGARYGINQTGIGNLTVKDCSFETHIASTSGGVYAIRIGGTNGVKSVTDCNFLSSDTVSNGGIWVDSLLSVTLWVEMCDFWGVGTASGCVGLSVTNSGTITVKNSVFANSRTQSLYGIKRSAGGSITITESDNTFYNITTPMSPSINGGVINGASSQSLTGAGTPSNSAVVIDMNSINNLLPYYGVTVQSDTVLQSFTGPIAITNYLKKAVRWHGLNKHKATWDAILSWMWADHAINFMKNVNAKYWENAEYTWNEQYDPAKWRDIKTLVGTAHTQCTNKLMMGGFLMEAIGKGNIENTPIPNKLWCWMVRWTRAVPMRPMTAITVNGIRRTGHFFDYDIMLGYGVNQWGTDISIPNLNKQESLMYYLYLTIEMVNAGMNCISYAQPQLTFGQNAGGSTGGTVLQMATKFAKNYGFSTNAYMLDTKRFVMIEANTIINSLRSYCNFVDLVTSPAGADSGGAGQSWSNLADAYNHIPPSSIGLTGKPLCLQIDNYGTGDQISVFAADTPANRNAWLTNFTSTVRGTYGYYMIQPGWTAITPSGCQSYAGFTTPSTDYPWPWFFVPWQEYSGCENTIKSIFAGN